MRCIIGSTKQEIQVIHSTLTVLGDNVGLELGLDVGLVVGLCDLISSKVHNVRI